jgi:hypothetical protein
MERERIYCLLENERALIVDPNTGHVMRAEAWKVVNVLLDSLVELQHMEEVIYE